MTVAQIGLLAAAFDGLLQHACYGEYEQGNENNLANWDVIVVRAQYVHSPDEPWMEEGT